MSQPSNGHNDRPADNPSSEQTGAAGQETVTPGGEAGAHSQMDPEVAAKLADIKDLLDEEQLIDPSTLPPSTVSREVHEAVLEAQTAELRDQMLRAVAETDNMRKRMEREVAGARKYAVTGFATDIVPLTDTFQRAIEAVPDGAVEADPALKSLLEGVIMTQRQFVTVLEKHGIKQVTPKGELFDPNFHQAIAQMQNPDIPAGTIMEVAQAGFALADRVIRPAMVVVAQGGMKPVREPGAAAVAPEAGSAEAATNDNAQQAGKHDLDPSSGAAEAGDPAAGEATNDDAGINPAPNSERDA